MRALLGGTGLTGPYVVRRLHALGHEVTVFHRGEHETDLPSGVRNVGGELAHLPRQLLHPAPRAATANYEFRMTGPRGGSPTASPRM